MRWRESRACREKCGAKTRRAPAHPPHNNLALPPFLQTGKPAPPSAPQPLHPSPACLPSTSHPELRRAPGDGAYQRDGGGSCHGGRRRERRYRYRLRRDLKETWTDLRSWRIHDDDGDGDGDHDDDDDDDDDGCCGCFSGTQGHSVELSDNQWNGVRRLRWWTLWSASLAWAASYTFDGRRTRMRGCRGAWTTSRGRARLGATFDVLSTYRTTAAGRLLYFDECVVGMARRGEAGAGAGAWAGAGRLDDRLSQSSPSGPLWYGLGARGRKPETNERTNERTNKRTGRRGRVCACAWRRGSALSLPSVAGSQVQRRQGIQVGAGACRSCMIYI